MPEETEKRSRRALLLAAAGGAAAVAAHAALPSAALAHDPDDLALNQDNATTADTGVTNSSGGNAFHAAASGAGTGLYGSSDFGAGVSGSISGPGGAAVAADGHAGPGVRAASASVAGVYAVSGDITFAADVDETASTGIYGYTPTSPTPETVVGVGVWGESADIGVYGNGAVGIAGDGFRGVSGYGYDPGGIGVLGRAADAGTYAVYADAGTNVDRVALRAKGRVVFDRSGRASMSAGQSAKTVYLAGVTGSSLVFAVLATNRTGRWVRAVVPTAGRFTIYLNTTLTAASYVIWWVLN
jgi:hypothetical protein